MGGVSRCVFFSTYEKIRPEAAFATIWKRYLAALPAEPAGAAVDDVPAAVAALAADDEAASAAAEAAPAAAEAAPAAASAEGVGAGAGAGAAAGAGAGAGAGSSFLPQAASAAAAIRVANKSDFFISNFLLSGQRDIYKNNSQMPGPPSGSSD
jgi:hypothetical protein